MQVKPIRVPFRIGTLHLPELEWKSYNSQRITKFNDRVDVMELLREALLHDPSDIHINVGHPIILEIRDQMHRLTGNILDATEFELFARIIRDKEAATTDLSQSKDYDGGFVFKDIEGAYRRMRVNMTALNSVRNGNAASIVLRPLQDKPPTVEVTGLPPHLVQRCFPKSGGVYVVGPTGSGKTSTFGSLIRYAAESGKAYHGHLRTYEAPPEFDLEALSSQHLLITQVAIGVPWGLANFADGVRNAMRAHPVAIMIGEVRDYETVSAVVEAALTGHPVFGTIHADNPAVAFQRLITRYPAERAQAGMYDLISTTEVIIAQRLVKCLDGSRAALREWLCFDNDVRRQLLRARTPGEVSTAMMSMVENKRCGQSFGESARQLFEAGRISLETAMSYGYQKPAQESAASFDQ